MTGADDPYPLRPGHDYHLAEASRMIGFPDGETLGWHAGCKACGWLGPDRDTKAAADEDGYAHDVTHNT